MEFSLLSFYFSLNTKNIIAKKIIVFLIIPFVCYCIYDYISADTPSFAFLPLVIECLTLLAVLIFLFYEKIKNITQILLYETSFFWIAVAFVFYFSGNFFLFLYSQNSYHDQTFKDQYTIIYTCVTVIKNILLCIGVSIKDKDIKAAEAEPMFLDDDLDMPKRNSLP